MKCVQCAKEKFPDREFTERELAIHKKYFHKNIDISAQKLVAGVCPDCGGTLMMQEGCQMCHCGYSKC